MRGNYRYIGKGETWPHSTGRGAEIDQKEAGKRYWSVEVSADGLSEALELVELYARGIETNPLVWMAPIHSIAKVQS